jgi:Ca2+-binding EF-hand superfamily protein
MAFIKLSYPWKGEMNMGIMTIILTVPVCLGLVVSMSAQNAPKQGGGMVMKIYNVDEFVAKVDTDKDGSMTQEEWKEAGLVEMPYNMCDSDKDGKLAASEFAGCNLPEAMDANADDILTVTEMIEFDKKMMSAPKKMYAATSPYVEGGETGMDFIKLFDADKDGKVTHMEWEQKRPSTVFKDKHWPEYNKNMDGYITVDEAPKKPEP